MTVFYSHQDRLGDRTGEGRSRAASLTQLSARWVSMLARQAVGRAGAALRVMHQAIVTARTRRLQRELRFHAGSGDGGPSPGVRANDDPDVDGARIPQRPLILGDKWDF